jgi:phage-related protein
MYTIRVNNNWKVYYYQKGDGTHPVKEYIDSLTKREKANTLAFIELLQNTGPNLKRPYADLLRDGIHELRLKLTGTQVRILYFFCFQNAIVLTNVFEKHTDAVPESEINTALNCRADFYERFTEKDLQEDENDEF